jgi:tryptophan-rich sensory protein
MNDGASSLWYKNLNRAFWEPPGWVFGFAWTIVMTCFSIYLAFLFNIKQKINIISFKSDLVKIYIVHLILNISWNYLFFNKQMIEIALFDILLLSMLMFYFLFKYFPFIKFKSSLIIPYCMWLLIATSLNLYIVIYN